MCRGKTGVPKYFLANAKIETEENISKVYKYQKVRKKNSENKTHQTFTSTKFFEPIL